MMSTTSLGGSPRSLLIQEQPDWTPNACSETEHIPTELEWSLNPENTMMHSLFPSLAAYVFSKYVVSFVASLFAVWTVMYFTVPPWIHHLYWVICSWTCFIPWYTCTLMLVNRSMFPKVYSNLDTWIKTLSTIFLFVNGAIWFHHDLDPGHPRVPIPLQLSCYISLLIVFILFILMISSIDGLCHWKRVYKVLFIGFMALYFGFLCFLVEFKFQDYEMVLPLIHQSVSIKSNMVSALRILFIFL